MLKQAVSEEAGAVPDCARANVLQLAAERYGTPCYVYILDEIVHRLDAIRSAFGDRFMTSYAVKANPNPELLGALEACVPFLDVSSGGEFVRGLECGYGPERLSFTGPGKSQEELQLAVEGKAGEIVVESLEELADVDRLSRECGVTANVVLRISPASVPKGFGVSMAGRPSQFGIDEEELDDAIVELKKFENVSFSGFHIYAGAQCLQLDSIVENFENYIRIFESFATRHDLIAKCLIFGSGIGIPYHDGDVAVDLDELGKRLNPALDRLRECPAFLNAQFRLEIGRLLVGEAGYFLTTIRRAKHSRGRELRICDGGLNNHLAACGHFGTIIHRNYKMTKLGSPEEPAGDESDGSFDVFGPLCTSIDQLARNLKMGSLECGDVLAIMSSGAYGYSASPMQFIAHPPAKEIIAGTCNGEIKFVDVSV